MVCEQYVERGNDATTLNGEEFQQLVQLKGVLEIERAEKPSALSLWGEGSFSPFLLPSLPLVFPSFLIEFIFLVTDNLTI